MQATDFRSALKENGFDVDYAVSSLIACFSSATLFRGQSPIFGMIFGKNEWWGFRGDGLSDLHYVDLAMLLAEGNPDVKILSEDQYPFVAVVPERIKEINVTHQQSVIQLANCDLSIRHQFDLYARADDHAKHMRGLLELHQDALRQKRLHRLVDGNVIYPNFGREK